MSKRFLGLVCLIYSILFGYVVLFDKLKNFLAPQMQIYIKLSIIPMFVMGIVLTFNKKIKYKFKISDLILILPIFFLILSGDGRLSSSFASNRAINLNNKNRVKSDEKYEEFNDDELKTFDFSSPYFKIVDSNYEALSDYITFAPKADKFRGQTIRVKGFVLKEAPYLPDGFFALGKYAISCCVADAGFSGFAVKYDIDKVIDGEWYEIEGVLEKGRDNEGYDMMYIRVANIRRINSRGEKQYVYPCYIYSQEACESMAKYEMEY